MTTLLPDEDRHSVDVIFGSLARKTVEWTEGIRKEHNIQGISKSIVVSPGNGNGWRYGKATVEEASQSEAEGCWNEMSAGDR